MPVPGNNWFAFNLQLPKITASTGCYRGALFFCIYHFWDYICLPQSCLKSAITRVWICQRKKKKKVMLCLNIFSLMGQSQKTVFACFVTPRQNSFSKSVSAEGWERNCTPHFWFSKLQCLRFSHNCKSNRSFCDFCGKIGVSFEKLLLVLRYFSERNV